MRTVLVTWLDNRTAFRKVIDLLLIEEIPGGAKWRYVWGSCLAFVFSIQLVTGILLVTAYSPGDSTAWASVYFIQYEMDFGWFIRGLHHFGSQTMVVLLALHMLQVVIAGAHLPPREVNWWLGLGLLAVTLGLSLTGYLLPWDQKGYWATQVATNIAGNMPVIGPTIQKIVVGGSAYGHHTLTRFFSLHVVILPATLIGLLIAHLAVFRKHGVTYPKNATGEGWFWPDQAFRDLVVCLITFAIMVTLVLLGHAQPLERDPSVPVTMWESIAHAGRDGRGANLDAPADPSSEYPARPEWYFLFLFQLLKYFEGDREILGTLVIPGLVGIVLAVLPLLGFGRLRAFGHIVGVLVIVGLIGGAGYLTYEAIEEDTYRGSVAILETKERVDAGRTTVKAEELARLSREEQATIERNEKAYTFHASMELASKAAQRAVQLASGGIPAGGAVNLLRRDPLTRGPELFRNNCGSCHGYGEPGQQASDLKGFGTEEWVLGLLKNASDPKYFGNTSFSEMGDWSAETAKDMTPEKEGQLKQIAAWLAGHPTSKSPEAESETFKKAKEAFTAGFNCMDCHKFEGGDGHAPDLAGYGSASWIRGMILSPDHPSRYADKNAMPIFLDLDGPAGPTLRDEATAYGRENITHLSDIDREIIIRWLTGDHRVVFGGDPIAE